MGVASQCMDALGGGCERKRTKNRPGHKIANSSGAGKAMPQSTTVSDAAAVPAEGGSSARRRAGAGGSVFNEPIFQGGDSVYNNCGVYGRSTHAIEGKAAEQGILLIDHSLGSCSTSTASLSSPPPSPESSLSVQLRYTTTSILQPTIGSAVGSVKDGVNSKNSNCSQNGILHQKERRVSSSGPGVRAQSLRRDCELEVEQGKNSCHNSTTSRVAFAASATSTAPANRAEVVPRVRFAPETDEGAVTGSTDVDGLPVRRASTEARSAGDGDTPNKVNAASHSAMAVSTAINNPPIAIYGKQHPSSKPPPMSSSNSTGCTGRPSFPLLLELRDDTSAVSGGSNGGDCFVPHRNGMHTAWRRAIRVGENSNDEEGSTTAAAAALEEEEKKEVNAPQTRDAAPPPHEEQKLRGQHQHQPATRLFLRREALLDSMFSSASEIPAQRSKTSPDPARLFLRRHALSSVSVGENNDAGGARRNSCGGGAVRVIRSVGNKSPPETGRYIKRVTGSSLTGASRTTREPGGLNSEAVGKAGGVEHPVLRGMPTSGVAHQRPHADASRRPASVAPGRQLLSLDENGTPTSRTVPISAAAIRKNLARAARASKVGTRRDPVTLYRQRQEMHAKSASTTARRSRDGMNRCHTQGAPAIRAKGADVGGLGRLRRTGAR